MISSNLQKRITTKRVLTLISPRIFKTIEGDLITIKSSQINNNLFKRIFDIISSSLVLIFLLSWVFPIISLLIKLNSKGPIIFQQKRIGINGDIFYCFKFRTMRVLSQSKYTPTQKNDIRVTKIGSFLRKTNLDELPQILNVLLGDMSIIGPRPHPIAFHNEYATYIDNIDQRLFIKPGITGLAQIKGYRGDVLDKESNMQRTKMRVNLDILYIKKWSSKLDIYIVYKTAMQMLLKQTNAH